MIMTVTGRVVAGRNQREAVERWENAIPSAVKIIHEFNFRSQVRNYV